MLHSILLPFMMRALNVARTRCSPARRGARTRALKGMLPDWSKLRSKKGGGGNPPPEGSESASADEQPVPQRRGETFVVDLKSLSAILVCSAFVLPTALVARTLGRVEAKMESNQVLLQHQIGELKSKLASSIAQNRVFGAWDV
eukprot:TRINITY_DN974_c0_g1_i3.p1 TRINITY_DN974_c0_g1~~TRINITY_DN974_c0_g1_i3.p1  ORF type:complete len:144 (+),score=9.45 TRINITY_DN974_c0_g1_i3:175-606(+)